MFVARSGGVDFVPRCAPAKGGGSSRPAEPGAASVSRREPLTPPRPDHSFGRDRRLLTGRSFRRVFEAPVRSSDRYFSIFARARDNAPGTPTARLGLAIAKKRVRRAHRRNRLKRLVRESFRENQHQLSGLDLVVTAHTAAEREPGATLRDSLQRHWRELSSKAGHEPAAE